MTSGEIPAGTRQRAPVEPVDGRDWLFLGLIVLLALVLRLGTLDGPLWYDEIITVETHLKKPWSEMVTDYQMNHHYLFSFQAKVFADLFGMENWAIRMPALIFGLASLVATWFLARDVAGKEIAHLATLLLAISFHHIWFSTNARGYAELHFFSTLGMILWLRGIRTPDLRTWLAYGVVLALAVYTHLTGAFFFAAQGVFWVLIALKVWAFGGMYRACWLHPALGYILGGVLAALFYAPVIPSMLETIGGVSETSAVDLMKEYQNPLWTIVEAVRTAMGNFGWVVRVVAPPVVFLVILGSVGTHRRYPLFAPLTIGHIAMTMAVLVALGMRVWPRFFYVDIGFLMILIVLGVRETIEGFLRVTELKWPARRLFQLAAVAMIVISAGMAARNYLAPKQDYVGAVALIAEQAQAGDRVYAVGVAQEIFLGHFATGWGAITDDAGLAATLAEPGPVWLVVAFPSRSFRDISGLDPAIEAEFDLVETLPGSLGDGLILIYRRG